MNSQQQTAIGNLCEFAEQCSDQRYSRTVRRFVSSYLLTIKTLLTVNIGDE